MDSNDGIDKQLIHTHKTDATITLNYATVSFQNNVTTIKFGGVVQIRSIFSLESGINGLLVGYGPVGFPDHKWRSTADGIDNGKCVVLCNVESQEFDCEININTIDLMMSMAYGIDDWDGSIIIQY